MAAHTEVSRREFLQTATVAGAGLVIGFHLPTRDRRGIAYPAAFAPNAWLRINPDESVLVIVDRSEMGQGVTTSLPMLLAEELEADWSKIKIESAPADKAYINPLFGMQATGGSTSVRGAYTPLRKAGAAAREMLVTAAAQTWGVDKSACRAEKGAVIHTSSKRQLTYGKLIAKAATVPLPQDVPLKEPKDWKILGTRVSRLDTPPKVDGAAGFGIDVKAPGLLVGVIARSPVFGGKVKSFDAAKAKAVPGVRQVVQVSTGVAVVGDGYWPAKKGRDALEITWDEGPTATVSSASISELFAKNAEQAGAVARHDGDAQGALPGAASKLDAVYELPFLAHATMEPMNCTAHVRSDGVDIWAPTQFQTGAQGLGAGIGGVPPEKVKVHTTYLGGGFGRRFEL
ncbi:MAG TPA: molybdopterin cofactor-binding domain-containing protein, partial [Gemmatimonadales bacterium]|nr:molybdopterin cofactor-binding domain-containing protein [Gemmatimonadales bacterium]